VSLKKLSSSFHFEIIEDLKEAKLLLRQEPIKHMVNVHDKCGTEIEFLKTKQWFIRVLDQKAELLEAANKINWHPKHMKVRYDHWVQNLQWDWCISRQRFFGVPFPIWYCKKCNEPVVADVKDLPVDPLQNKPSSKCKCGSTEFEPEKDVMDTWATSSITPQIISKWNEDESFFKLTYPNDLRPQAHDIIRTWAFYTIVKSLYHTNEIPWKNIMVSGHALDSKGKKMSKSKGNTVDPRDVLEKYGADALRFWAAGSKLGDDLSYQEKDLVTGQKMVTKLWNASRFVIMNLENYDMEEGDVTFMDKWMLSKLNKLIKSATETFDVYEYAKVKQDVEKFFWHTFCDNYLEVVKDRVYNPDKHGAKSIGAQYVLYRSLLSILKLTAPIMPFITEEIYQMYFKDKDKAESIHISAWPEFDEQEINEDAERAGDLAIEVIAAVRKVKSEQSKSLKEPIKKLTIETEDSKPFDLILDDLKATTRAETIEFGKGELSCPSGIKLKIEF
ncbi:class I tRNA ligase family protein, partial [Nanoarchaeota archaeon]